ncbi:MAG TPA: hypothetical protein VF719_02190 [Abditibacteriaceae bacterium]|jgi:hypothetical protein
MKKPPQDYNDLPPKRKASARRARRKAAPEPPPPPPRRRKRWIAPLVLGVMVAGTFAGIMAGNGLSPQEVWKRVRGGDFSQLSLAPRRTRMTRPPGMAPVAYEGYLRACAYARVHPFRISQTIGDYPRSVGYHHRDGILRVGNEKIEYTAAVDIATNDLNRAQIDRLVRKLSQQGFAAFYREGPRWKGGEHIHAVYALLPMKPQLRGQVVEFLRDRRIEGARPHRWETRLRRRWGLRRA